MALGTEVVVFFFDSSSSLTGCMAIAELGRRGLLLPSRLAESEILMQLFDDFSSNSCCSAGFILRHSQRVLQHRCSCSRCCLLRLLVIVFILLSALSFQGICAGF
jgi:hypothetical protein